MPPLAAWAARKPVVLGFTALATSRLLGRPFSTLGLQRTGLSAAHHHVHRISGTGRGGTFHARSSSAAQPIQVTARGCCRVWSVFQVLPRLAFVVHSSLRHGLVVRGD